MSYSDKYGFYQWLHDVTVFGYDKNVTIPVGHEIILAYLYHKGFTAEDAFNNYFEFLQWRKEEKNV